MPMLNNIKDKIESDMLHLCKKCNSLFYSH